MERFSAEFPTCLPLWKILQHAGSWLRQQARGTHDGPPLQNSTQLATGPGHAGTPPAPLIPTPGLTLFGVWLSTLAIWPSAERGDAPCHGRHTGGATLPGLDRATPPRTARAPVLPSRRRAAQRQRRRTLDYLLTTTPMVPNRPLPAPQLVTKHAVREVKTAFWVHWLLGLWYMPNDRKLR